MDKHWYFVVLAKPSDTHRVATNRCPVLQGQSFLFLDVVLLTPSFIAQANCSP